MKAKLIVSVLAALFAVLLPVITIKAPAAWEAAGKKNGRSGITEPENSGADDTADSTADSAEGDVRTYVDDTEVVVLMNGQAVTMELEEYLVGVVAGEMPASFETEALKAQAVAARTYTLYKMLVSPSANHEEDVCTDPACCKAYSDEETLRGKWGDSFEANMAKITSAVWDTRGEYMIYEGEPVLAVFHSSSAGATENSGSVWNSQLPYLVSVESPESSESVSNFVSTLAVSQEDFRETVKEYCPDAVLDGEASGWITDVKYTDSGRILSLRIGGADVRGTELRAMFQLRSTAAEIEVKNGEIVFTVTGYGHGVGMSQYGANIMAGEGKTYRDILRWYYTGVSFAVIVELF